MITRNELPSSEFLNQCFVYNPDTGQLTWRERPVEHFKCLQSWRASNTKYAGKDAGWKNFFYDGTPMNIIVGVGVKKYVASRVIMAMTGEPLPELVEVDHIDGDPHNNRRINLRRATHQQNRINAGVRPDNASGFPGVVWDKNRNKWKAMIGVNGKCLNIGRYAAFEAAVSARKEAEEKYFGEYRRVA